MQQVSSIELMHAETDEEVSASSWMNIRFRHTLPPLDGANATANDEGLPEAEGHHVALDVREQLSHIGQRYQNNTSAA